MASHHSTIAKATFAASLLRPDVTKVSRDELQDFHSFFESTATKGSSSNIQTCKQWLFSNITPSQHRSIAFAKYLSAFGRQLTRSEEGANLSAVSRQRLHLLYLIHDLLHHAKYHVPALPDQNNLTTAFQPQLIDLFQLAASDQKRRIHRRLGDLVKLWQHEEYFEKEQLAKIQNIIEDPTSERDPASSTGGGPSTSISKETPFVMPLAHGDPSLPFYELPAGNFMPHITPNRTLPMRPNQIRALQFAPGAADERLVHAVKDFLREVEYIDNVYDRLEDEGIVADIDEMGQVSYKDEAGDLVGDTYYGWSRAFCDKMKARRKDGGNGIRGRSRSPSFSSSHSRSRSPRKRQRHSYDSGHSSSRSRSPRGADTSQRRDGSSSAFQHASDEDRPAQAVRLMPTPPTFMNQRSFDSGSPVPPPPSGTTGMPMPPFRPPPLGPNGMPIPPPRPSNWTGPWPPPPPPPPPPGPVHGHSPFVHPPPSISRQWSGPSYPPASGFNQYGNR